MSLFKTEECPICNIPTTAIEKTSVKYNGAYLCKDCLKKLGAASINVFGLKKYTLEQLKQATGNTASVEEQRREMAEFVATKKVGAVLYVDEEHKKWGLPKVNLKGELLHLQVFDYSDILSYEVIDDGKSVVTGGVGRAIVGGALFGGVGAVVGAVTANKVKKTCSKLQVKITLNRMQDTVKIIDLITTETKVGGMLYNMAMNTLESVTTTLDCICHENENQQISQATAAPSVSIADELKKYKELLDIGAISEDEFKAVKQKLLG